MSFKELNDLVEEEGAPRREERPARPPVLVVDDDPTIRKSLTTLLRDRYEVIPCASAKEGVSAVHEGVCVAILDVKMGRYDGFWACQEIHRNHPDIPVIFYSAYQDAKDPYDIINNHRPFAYITKDGDVTPLLNAVERAVRLALIIQNGKKLIDSHRKRREPA
jgi:DNA-binding NtrC family response regulator